MWIEASDFILSVEEWLEIIDDALCHGFEFKVENGNLYYREIG